MTLNPSPPAPHLCTQLHSGKDMMVFLMMSAHSSSCSSVSVRGGARRMMLPCVGLASSPFSFRRMQMSQAEGPWSSLTTMALNSPFPRTCKLHHT